MAGVDRPELFSELVETLEGVEAISGEAVDLAVDLGEAGEVLVSLDLEVEALCGVEA